MRHLIGGDTAASRTYDIDFDDIAVSQTTP
jgi:hypothetical protein